MLVLIVCLKYNIVCNLDGGKDHQAAGHWKEVFVTVTLRLPVPEPQEEHPFVP